MHLPTPPLHAINQGQQEVLESEIHGAELANLHFASMLSPHISVLLPQL
jgi:hypothetical protein